MQTNLSFASILEPYQNLIEQSLRDSIDQLGPKNAVRDACEYALLNGGNVFGHRLS